MHFTAWRYGAGYAHPPTDAFTVETCRASLRQALDFFAQQSPEKTIRAGFCHTWFFTHPLQEFLPAESHIVQFQREFYLYPHPGGPGFLWEFAFGEKYRDLATAPRDTRLRRAVLDWLGQGKELFDLPGYFSTDRKNGAASRICGRGTQEFSSVDQVSGISSQKAFFSHQSPTMSRAD